LLLLFSRKRPEIGSYNSQASTTFSVAISPSLFGPAALKAVSRDNTPMQQPVEGRVVVSSGPDGLRVEIRPLARTRGARRRLALAVIFLLASAFFGGARLVQAWETGL